MQSEQQSNFQKTKMPELSTGETFLISSQQRSLRFQKKQTQKKYSTSDKGNQIKNEDQIQKDYQRLCHSAECCLLGGNCPFLDQIIFYDVNQHAEIQEQDLLENAQQPEQKWFTWFQDQLVNTSKWILKIQQSACDPMEIQESEDLYKIQSQLEQANRQSKTHHFQKNIHSFFKKMLESKINAVNDPKLQDVFQLFLKCDSKKLLCLLLKDHSLLQTYQDTFFDGKAESPQDFKKTVIKFVQIFSEISFHQVSDQLQKKHSSEKNQDKKAYFGEFLQDIKKRNLKVTKHLTVRILGP